MALLALLATWRSAVRQSIYESSVDLAVGVVPDAVPSDLRG